MSPGHLIIAQLNIRQIIEPTQGTELVPQQKNKSLTDDQATSGDVGWEDVPEFEPTDAIDSSVREAFGLWAATVAAAMGSAITVRAIRRRRTRGSMGTSRGRFRDGDQL